MTREVHVQLPAVAGRRLDRDVVELLAVDARLEPGVAHLVPDLADLTFGPEVIGIVAEDEGVAGVALGVPVDGTDVDEEDVVLAEDHAGLRLLHEVLRRVGPAAHDDVVPAPAHAQLLEGVAGDGLGLFLGHARLHLVGDEVHRLAGAGPDIHQGIEREVLAGALELGGQHGGHEYPSVVGRRSVGQWSVMELLKSG